MENGTESVGLEKLLHTLEGADSGEPIRTTFRISRRARETLALLANRSGRSMKDQIDLIAIDLFHPHAPLQNLLNDFLSRSAVDADAVRRTQSISYEAKELIERKAESLGIHRDQVLQQAILFQLAIRRYSASDEEQMEVVRLEVSQAADMVVQASRRVNDAIGSSHPLACALSRIARELRTLGESPSSTPSRHDSAGRKGQPSDAINQGIPRDA